MLGNLHDFDPAKDAVTPGLPLAVGRAGQDSDNRLDNKRELRKL